MQKRTWADSNHKVEGIVLDIREKLADRGVMLDRRQALAVILLLIVTIAGSLLLYRASQPEPVVVVKAGDSQIDNAGASIKEKKSPPKQPREKEAPMLFVHVAGAVTRPGVYQVKEGSRVIDALGAAGGALKASDANALNLAAKVCDGQKIYVPRKGESLPAQMEEAAGSSASLETGAKVNLNTATMEQLDALPGIGPSTAKKIIDYRNKSGPFKRVEGLKDVDGIGTKKYEQLKDLLCVD